MTDMVFLISDLTYFARWLLMYADGVEVIKTEELKNKLHDLVTKLEDKAGNPVIPLSHPAFFLLFLSNSRLR